MSFTKTNTENLVTCTRKALKLEVTKKLQTLVDKITGMIFAVSWSQWPWVVRSEAVRSWTLPLFISDASGLYPYHYQVYHFPRTSCWEDFVACRFHKNKRVRNLGSYVTLHNNIEHLSLLLKDLSCFEDTGSMSIKMKCQKSGICTSLQNFSSNLFAQKYEV